MIGFQKRGMEIRLSEKIEITEKLLKKLNKKIVEEQSKKDGSLQERINDNITIQTLNLIIIYQNMITELMDGLLKWRKI